MPPAFRYSNQTGVEIRPMDWGGLGGVESLDPSLPQITPVYKSLTEGLKKAGYAERVDLFGAPYDFRLAADGLEQVSILMTTVKSFKPALLCLSPFYACTPDREGKFIHGVHAGWVLSEFDESGGARRGQQ